MPVTAEELLLVAVKTCPFSIRFRLVCKPTRTEAEFEPILYCGKHTKESTIQSFDNFELVHPINHRLEF